MKGQGEEIRVPVILRLVIATVSITSGFASAAGAEPYHPQPATPSNTNPVNTYQVPTFDIADLKSGRPNDRLVQVLESTGLLAITLDEASGLALNSHRSLAFDGLCRCASADANGDDTRSSSSSVPLLSVPGTDSAILTDATTTRTTLATATIGYTPLPLPGIEVTESCGTGPEFVDALESLRDVVADASSAFMGAVDGIIGGGGGGNSLSPSLLKTANGASYGTISDIVGASKNLEHFHVYSRDTIQDGISSNDESNDALRLHTDAGLFLSFIPALSCSDAKNSNYLDESFYVLDPQDGQTKVAEFPRGVVSVAIMLGIGAESWLNTEQSPSSSSSSYGRQALKLRATRHKVHMKNGDRRAWYGMMHLVPDTAIVQRNPQRTFADMRHYVAHRSTVGRRYGDDVDETETEVAIGCGVAQYAAPSPNNGVEESTPVSTRLQRRRLQHVVDGSVCNNVTNFYCWMTCQEIPDAENAASRLQNGESLYCLDPSVLGSKEQLPEAVTQCIDYRGVLGAAENAGCTGSWQTTAVGVPKQHISNMHQQHDGSHDTNVDSQQAENLPEYEEKYCYGSTTMYMHGFEWQGTTCVAYLFQSWVLNTPVKFGVAAIGTVFFGVLLEGSIHLRRTLISSVAARAAATDSNDGGGWQHTAVSAGTYMVQLTLGYLIMLVIMTYSAPLFIAVVVGLGSGHILFSMLRTRKEKSCQCAPTDEGNHGKSLSSVGNSVRYAMAEGATPCCMNEIPTQDGALSTNPLLTPVDDEEENCCDCKVEDDDDEFTDDCHKESANTTSCCESGTGSDSV